MEEFRTLFLRLCKEHGIDPQEGVLQKIQEISSESIATLDLSNSSLTVSTCAILGKVLAHDLAFTSVVLSDCMLNEEGAKLLLAGLAKNTVVKRLDLRGNNLRQTTADAIGKFLKENHILDELLLEWNSLGVWESSFAALCEGIASNVTLKYLDLRNNQIDHTGAQEIALALRSNNTLRNLDLRWNNIGLVGGRSLSEALQQNHGISKIDVTGNGIPRDVLTSIETSALHNEQRSQMNYDQMHKTRTLTNEIEFLKSEKKKQMINFMDDIEMTRSQLDASNRASSNKITHLQETLEERKAALNALRAKLDMSEAALTLSDQKVKDQQAMLELSRKENLDSVKNYENQIKREREDKHTMEEKLSKQLETTSENLAEANATVGDLERKVKMQQDQILALKENIAHLKSEHRIALSNADERLAQERRRMQMEAREQEEVRMRDIERMRIEMEDGRRLVEDRAEKMRLSRQSLAKEMTELSTKMSEERLEHDDALRDLRSQLKTEKDIHTEQLQEKIRSLIAEKSELQKKIASLSSDLAEVTAARSSSTIEIEGLRRTLDGVKRQLENKDIEHDAEINRVAGDLKKRISRLQDENAESSDLRAQVKVLEAQLSEMASSNNAIIEDRDRKIEQLKESLHQYEMNAQNAKDAAAAKAIHLQQEFMAYVQSVQSGFPSTSN